MKSYNDLSLKNLEGEKWKDCTGYEGSYQVSNIGRVKSLERTVVRSDGRTMRVNLRILRQAINKKDKYCKYLFVVLYLEGKGKMFEVHRLMANTFIKQVKEKLYVVHNDHDTLHNIDTNLRYADAVEKSEQTFEIGNQYANCEGKFGKDHYAAKPVMQCNMDGKKLQEFAARTDAARWLIENKKVKLGKLCNITSAITKSCKGTASHAYGYKWKDKLILN